VTDIFRSVSQYLQNGDNNIKLGEGCFFFIFPFNVIHTVQAADTVT
jgi:hypothetical protein